VPVEPLDRFDQNGRVCPEVCVRRFRQWHQLEPLSGRTRDSRRFATTGGWGFQRFAGSSKTELAATPTPQQCFACHDRLKKDGLVLSSYRP
jgi:hypothetical protein